MKRRREDSVPEISLVMLSTAGLPALSHCVLITVC